MAPRERAALALLVSHAAAQWGWRSWEFAVALLLGRIFPGAAQRPMPRLRLLLSTAAGTLAPVSAYGLADDLFRVASGGAVGRKLDSSGSRVATASHLYALQHGAVAVSAAAALLAAAAPAGTVRDAAAVLLVLAGASAGVGAAGSSLAVERQFTKALCGANTDALARVNARMRATDLVCLLLAPLFAGALLQGAGLGIAVAALMSYNVLAFWPERALLRAAAASEPALEARSGAAEESSDAGRGPGWRDLLHVYARQRVLAPALALALLYFTVLSLGFLMTEYLYARGVADVEVAIIRGAGAVSGLAATAVFPRAARGMPLRTIAAAGVSTQLLCLLVGVLPQLLAPREVAGGPPMLRLLMAMLALSRFGLWTADLAVNQMLQDEVLETELGAVNGVQASVCAAFEMASFVAGLAFSAPADFPGLMAGSCGAVAISAVMMIHQAVQAGPDAAPPTATAAEAEGEAERRTEDAAVMEVEMETAPLLHAAEQGDM